MQFNNTKRYFLAGRKATSGGGSGASILDQDYGSVWAADAANGRSARVIYNQFQLIGYVQGNIAYQNIVGGNDSTAVLGNQLRPFKTIGAAITAIGFLENSLISCSAGVNNIYDLDCPQGLKVQGSKYDIYIEKGCTINYYGTYGVNISDRNTGGNILGGGKILNYSSIATGVVEGISGYTFNVEGADPPYGNKVYQFERLVNYANINLARVGDCVHVNSNVTFSAIGPSYILGVNSADKTVITLDPLSITAFNGFTNGGYIGNALAGTGLVLKMNNPESVDIDRCVIYSHGNQFGAAMPGVIEIKAETTALNIKIANSEVRFAGSESDFCLINFSNTISDYTTVVLHTCRLKSRNGNAYPLGGYSLKSNNDVSIKVIDTYANMDIKLGTNITNAVSSGNGFMVEPNL